MTDAQRNLDALKAQIHDVSAFLPDLEEEIVSLHAVLDNVLTLNLRAPVRLMGLDLQNVADNLAKTIVFKKRNISNVHLQNAVNDIRTLVLDMHQRAQMLIEQESQIISINAHASNNRVMSAPMDLTAQMERFSIKAKAEVMAQDTPSYAIPASGLDDAPGSIIDISDFYNNPDDAAFGRLSGPFITLDEAEKIGSMEYKTSILPAGSMVVFKPGQVIKLFISSNNFEDRFTAPARRSNDIRVRIIEIGEEGATLYGPAAFKVVEDAHRALSENKAFFKTFKKSEPKNPYEGRDSQIQTVKDLEKANKKANSGQILLLAMVIVSFLALPLAQFFMTSTILASISLYGLNMSRKNLKKIQEIKNNLQNYASGLSNYLKDLEGLCDNPAFDKMCLLKGVVSQKMTHEKKISLSLKVFSKMAHTSKHASELNFRPGLKIQSSGVGDVNLLAPLLALPSPEMVYIKENGKKHSIKV